MSKDRFYIEVEKPEEYSDIVDELCLEDFTSNTRAWSYDVIDLEKILSEERAKVWEEAAKVIRDSCYAESEKSKLGDSGHYYIRPHEFYSWKNAIICDEKSKIERENTNKISMLDQMIDEVNEIFSNEED